MKRDLDWHHDGVEDLFEIAVRDARLGRKIMTTVRSYRIGDRVDLKKLRGLENDWRIRVGDWRVIVRIRDGRALLVGIDNRRDAY